MKPVLIARAQRLLIGTALLSVILGIFAYTTSNQNVQSVASTLSAATFLERVDELFSSIQDAETGQRGYLLTNRRDYLGVFSAARDELPRRFRLVDELAAKNGVPESQLRDLRRLVDEKISELELTVELEDQGRYAAAMAEVETDRGQKLMTQIRSLITAIKTRQEEIFQDRLVSQQHRQVLLNTVLILAIAVALAFLVFAYQFSSRFAEQRATVEQDIRGLNATLEGRVRARTAELEESARELQMRSRELERSNADLSQFAYVASHDLQEPLRMVATYMGLLEKRYADALDERAKSYVRFAVEGAIRMQTLINDLLQYSRAGTQPVIKRLVASEELVKTALKNLEIAVRESGAEIHYNGLPAVEADPTKMTQVFQNLISNAIKFRKQGCRPEIGIRVDTAGGECKFSVADNGIGFDTAYQDRIYEIFQRLHSGDQYAGNGIGLSICKRIIEQHGGRLWAESKLDVGSTFYFTLPR